MTAEQQKLVENNHNLIYAFLKQEHLPAEDFYDVLAIGLCKAAIGYKSNLGYTFSTYAYKVMLNQILREKKKEHTQKYIPADKMISFQEELFGKDGDTFTLAKIVPSKENVQDTVLAEYIFSDFLSKLGAKEQKIFLLLKIGYKQTEVAEFLGVSHQYVSKIAQKLQEYLKK